MDMHEKIQSYLKGDKSNYDLELQKIVKTWKIENKRPTILLHSCCAPCSTYSLEVLCVDADVTVYFSNSNIYPRVEYQRRAQVQKKFIDDFNLKTSNSVQFIEAPYKPNEFIEMVIEKKLEKEPEGGKRCTACFDMRLDDVAKKAQEMGFDYFASALSISPHKNSQVVNAVGYEVQKVYDVAFLPSDFKKRGGFYRSVEMCEEYDVYRQCYCGCVFSARDMGIDLREITKDAKAYLASIKEESE